jgi:hypothetical protein
VHLVSLSTTHLIPSIAITMGNKRQFDYSIGDRVAERPKIHGVFATHPDSIERIKQYRQQRYGEVVGINYKKNARGQQQRFLLVKWDYLNSPTEHSIARICPVSELERLSKQTIVPGE